MEICTSVLLFSQTVKAKCQGNYTKYWGENFRGNNFFRHFPQVSLEKYHFKVKKNQENLEIAPVLGSCLGRIRRQELLCRDRAEDTEMNIRFFRLCGSILTQENTCSKRINRSFSFFLCPFYPTQSNRSVKAVNQDIRDRLIFLHWFN